MDAAVAVALPATNVSSNGFVANWVYGVGESPEYIVEYANSINFDNPNGPLDAGSTQSYTINSVMP